MKRLAYSIAIVTFTLLTAIAAKGAEPFVFNAQTDTVSIAPDKFREFEKKPWK